MVFTCIVISSETSWRTGDRVMTSSTEQPHRPCSTHAPRCASRRPAFSCNPHLNRVNMQLMMILIPFRRRDFSMQTFVRPACALFFFPHCWSSDGCSNAPYAPAVQWPPPAKHWPICCGLTVQRPDPTAHCQSGTTLRSSVKRPLTFRRCDVNNNNNNNNNNLISHNWRCCSGCSLYNTVMITKPATAFWWL